MAKASFQVKTDVEGRRRWERKGLDTPVVNAVNDECLRLVKKKKKKKQSQNEDVKHFTWGVLSQG